MFNVMKEMVLSFFSLSSSFDEAYQTFALRLSANSRLQYELRKQANSGVEKDRSDVESLTPLCVLGPTQIPFTVSKSLFSDRPVYRSGNYQR